MARAPDLAAFVSGKTWMGVSGGRLPNTGWIRWYAQGLDGLALFERSFVPVGTAPTLTAAPGLLPAAVDVATAFPGSLGALDVVFVFLERAKKSSASSEDEFLAALEAGGAAAAAAAVATAGREDEAPARRLTADEEGFGRMLPPPPPAAAVDSATAGAGDLDVDGAVE